MTDVLQVLEFPKAKLYLLKQLRITKIIHITALKFTLSRGHLFGGGGWALNGGWGWVLILLRRDFGRGAQRGYI